MSTYGVVAEIFMFDRASCMFLKQGVTRFDGVAGTTGEILYFISFAF